MRSYAKYFSIFISWHYITWSKPLNVGKYIFSRSKALKVLKKLPNISSSYISLTNADTAQLETAVSRYFSTIFRHFWKYLIFICQFSLLALIVFSFEKLVLISLLSVLIYWSYLPSSISFRITPTDNKIQYNCLDASAKRMYWIETYFNEHIAFVLSLIFLLVEFIFTGIYFLENNSSWFSMLQRVLKWAESGVVYEVIRSTLWYVWYVEYFRWLSMVNRCSRNIQI